MTAISPLAKTAPPQTVADLVARAQAGDRVAEQLLCTRMAPAVRTFARRRLRGEDAVRDFQQDVMLLFVEALRRSGVEDPARIGGFVLGICRNVAHDRVRQRERRDALWEKYGSDVAPLDPRPLEQVNDSVLRLEDCLTNVSQRARDLLWLSYGEAKSHAEIAAHLQITEANARVLRHRTLESLRDCMGKPSSWEAA